MDGAAGADGMAALTVRPAWTARQVLTAWQALTVRPAWTARQVLTAWQALTAWTVLTARTLTLQDVVVLVWEEIGRGRYRA